MVRRLCKVCGRNWVVSPDAANVCDDCKSVFGIKDSHVDGDGGVPWRASHRL